MKKTTKYDFPNPGPAAGPAPEGPTQVDLAPEDRIKNDALAYPAQVATIAVVDQGTLDQAHAWLRKVKRAAEQIASIFDPHIRKALEAHRGLLAEKRRFTEPLERAEQILKPKITDYLAAEDRKRLEASRLRQLAEEKARREAEIAVDKAHALIEKGQAAKADQAIEKGYAKTEAILAEAPGVPDKPLAEGVQLRTTWDFEITDEAAIPREYLVPDLTRIRRVVQAHKGQARIPGIRAFSKQTIASRS